jgi:dipeptidyl aminopeptidase/acylaminoacyl peptidase
VVWAKNGQSIYFLSTRSGSKQIWQLPLTGGEAVQVSSLAVAVDGFKISDDEQNFALTLTVMPQCKTLQCTLDAQQKTANQKATTRHYQQLMVRHWDEWQTPFKQHVFIAKKDSFGKITQANDLISDWQSGIDSIADVAFAGDASTIVFSAKVAAKDEAWSTNFDLFEINLSNNSIKNITEQNKAWDAAPVFSADNRFLAYKSMSTPGYESDKFSINIRDNKTGRVINVAPNWDRSVSEMIFAADNRTLLVTAKDIGQTSIFAVNPEFGDVRRIYNVGTSGNIATVDDKVFFTQHSLNSAQDIFQIGVDGYGITQLTEVNKELLNDVTFGDYEQFSFKGWNNELVHGYWVKPANFEQGKKYPIAFLVHGGPQGSFGNQFHYRWNAQLWAAQGYGVVMIDFHGSLGYGQKFTDAITRDWGGKPLEDLQKGFDFIVEQESWLDNENACALGASYGGYMMNWIQGNWPEQFKCLVNHAGLFDLPSFYLSTEELWFPEHDLGGPIWSADNDYYKFNPSAFIKNWQTPMLVIQGELDYRVPYAQSLGAFTALQRKNIDSKLLMFPNEDHHIRNPDNLVVWYNEVFSWLKKYTKN